MLLAFLSAEACNPSDEEPYRPGTSVQPEEPGEPGGDGENNPDKDPDEDTMNSNTITLTAGGRSFTATLVENQATEALKARLAQGPVDIRMEDYGDMEKVGSFGFSLPRNDASTTTSPGDMVLYQGNSLVISTVRTRGATPVWGVSTTPRPASACSNCSAVWAP